MIKALKKDQSSYRSRETVVEGYKNQQSGDRNGNQKEEKGLGNHIKKEYCFPSTPHISFFT